MEIEPNEEVEKDSEEQQQYVNVIEVDPEAIGFPKPKIPAPPHNDEEEA